MPSDKFLQTMTNSPSTAAYTEPTHTNIEEYETVGLQEESKTTFTPPQIKYAITLSSKIPSEYPIFVAFKLDIHGRKPFIREVNQWLSGQSNTLVNSSS